MPSSFVSEPIKPLEGSFDPAGMARGEPGLPQKFRWRKKEYVIAEVLETWKEHGDCQHGSDERYLRKHGYRVRTEDGLILKLYFLRSFGLSRKAARWWIYSIEGEPSAQKSVILSLSKDQPPKDDRSSLGTDPSTPSRRAGLRSG